MNMTTRETWSSKLGFILAAVGAAVGLGAIWKFPYVCGQNGGGAFLLLFILFNFIIGLPLFIGELLLGRQSQKGVVSSFVAFSRPQSSWNLVGWMIVLVSCLILGWYCVVAGWGICYILLTLGDSFQGLSASQVGEHFDTFRSSGILNVVFQVIYIALNAVILSKGLTQGIEKWSKIMTSGLFIVLICLAIYSFQLEGFADAARYLLYPDFSKLGTRGVLQALSLALFTLSLSYGVMITYGSFLKNSDDIPKIAGIVVVANLVATMLIAVTIFPMIFTFGFEPQAGEGLIFKTLPFVFEQLPGSMIIALVFFVLLLFAGVTSSISMFEVVVTNFTDLTNMSRKKAIVIASCIAFILGLPTAIKDLFPDWQRIFGESYMGTSEMLIDWLLVIIALCTSIFIAFKLSNNTRTQGFCIGSRWQFLYKPWLLLLRSLVPLAIIIVFAQRAQIL
jgi:NSS family neurotransmitter:Na+ symporter